MPPFFRITISGVVSDHCVLLVVPELNGFGSVAPTIVWSSVNKLFNVDLSDHRVRCSGDRFIDAMNHMNLLANFAPTAGFIVENWLIIY